MVAAEVAAALVVAAEVVLVVALVVAHSRITQHQCQRGVPLCLNLSIERLHQPSHMDVCTMTLLEICSPLAADRLYDHTVYTWHGCCCLCEDVRASSHEITAVPHVPVQRVQMQQHSQTTRSRRQTCAKGVKAKQERLHVAVLVERVREHSRGIGLKLYTHGHDLK